MVTATTQLLKQTKIFSPGQLSVSLSVMDIHICMPDAGSVSIEMQRKAFNRVCQT